MRSSGRSANRSCVAVCAGSARPLWVSRRKIRAHPEISEGRRGFIADEGGLSGQSTSILNLPGILSLVCLRESLQVQILESMEGLALRPIVHELDSKMRAHIWEPG